MPRFAVAWPSDKQLTHSVLTQNPTLGVVYLMNYVISATQGPSRKQQKRALGRLLIARSDLSAAQHALKTLLHDVKSLRDPLVLPLHAAAVICYARPFTDNEEIGALPAKYSRFATEAAKQAHSTTIEIRNRFIAHSDFEAREPKISPAGWVIGEEQGRELRSEHVGAQVSTTLLGRQVLIQLYNNCIDIMNLLHVDIDALTEALYAGMELPARPFRLRINEGL